LELKGEQQMDYYNTISDFYSLSKQTEKFQKLNNLLLGSGSLQEVLKVKISINRANLYLEKNLLQDMLKELKYVEKVLPKYTKDSSLQVSYYSSLANYYLGVGESMYSIDANLKSIDYLGDQRAVHKGVILYNIANTFYEENLHFEALSNFRKSKRIFDLYAPERAIYADIALASVYLELDSLNAVKDILSKYSKLTDPNIKYNLWTINAQLEYIQKRYDIALAIVDSVLVSIKSNIYSDDYSIYKTGLLSALAVGDLQKAENLFDDFKNSEYTSKEENSDFSFRIDLLKLGLPTYLKYKEIIDQIIDKNSLAIAKNLMQKNNRINELEREKLLNQMEIADKVKSRNFKWLVGATTMVTILLLILTRSYSNVKKLSDLHKRQKSQIQLLNSELNHRVKNNLAFMTSLLEMQARRMDTPEAKQALRESESRLRALALVHTQLFKNEQNTTIDLKHYLTQIVDSLSNIFKTEENKLQISTDYCNYEINAEDAMRLGLIVNEKITNSVKHAFHKVDQPEINIKTFVNNENKFVLDYHDNGPGLDETVCSDNATEQSLGMKLIGLLKKQLGDGYLII
jgi:two-component sensor histidine kinase